MSNCIISAIRRFVPDEIRIPVFIVIIATAVKCVQFLMNAYTPSLYNSLGVFIPLIVVNCIILGRAESFASKHKVIDSLFDAIGMGLGYTFALLIISAIREFIGTGGLSFVNPFDSTQTIFSISIMKDFAVSLFSQPSGAFLTLGCILAFIQFHGIRKSMKISKGENK